MNVYSNFSFNQCFSIAASKWGLVTRNVCGTTRVFSSSVTYSDFHLGKLQSSDNALVSKVFWEKRNHCSSKIEFCHSCLDLSFDNKD